MVLIRTEPSEREKCRSGLSSNLRSFTGELVMAGVTLAGEALPELGGVLVRVLGLRAQGRSTALRRPRSSLPLLVVRLVRWTGIEVGEAIRIRRRAIACCISAGFYADDSERSSRPLLEGRADCAPDEACGAPCRGGSRVRRTSRPCGDRSAASSRALPVFGARCRRAEDLAQMSSSRFGAVTRAGVPYNREPGSGPRAKHSASTRADVRRSPCTTDYLGLECGNCARPLYEEDLAAAADARSMTSSRLVFTAFLPCCPPDSRVALTACGCFGGHTPGDRSASLHRSAVSQRIVRRAYSSARALSFAVPSRRICARGWPRWLDVFYLIFNEGYSASGRAVIRPSGWNMRCGRRILRELSRRGGSPRPSR